MNKSFKPNGGRPAKSNPQERGVQKNSRVGKLLLAPAAISRPIQSQRPQERLIRGGRSLVFKEYVQDIAGSVSFSANSFPVQPGIATLFAWLANQAASYQEYRFKRLRFIYETEKSSSTSGKIMLAFQPDAADPVPASKQEMLENSIKAANAVWAPVQCEVPLREALGIRRYIRTAVLAANLDIKTYDLGNLIVATQGCVDASAVGELYVEYEIELFTPVLSAAAAALAQSAAVVSGGTVSDSAIFGDAAVVTGGLNVTASGNVLTFNRTGRYAISLRCTGTGLFTVFTPTLTSPDGGSSGALLTGLSNAAANAGTLAIWVGYVYVVTRGTTLTIDVNASATTVTASVAIISPYSS